MLHQLENTIQRYAWGSATALTELYGVENPSGEPMAELWMGAHPRAPSRITVDDEAVTLDEYIAHDPERILGPASHRFDGELPFLFKILCAAEPLSIQVHPSLEQAARGFEREERAGIDRSAGERSYRDRNHKPEVICAIRTFWGLRGFRPLAEIRDEFTTVELSEADAELTLPSSSGELAGFFRDLITKGEDERRELIAAALALSRGRWPAGSAKQAPEPDDPLARYYWVLRIADVHPGDIGILSPLLLNVFSLRPGEATYQPAGVLHAYLGGVGVELMANSDNVLRGGMTVKHVDVDELMQVGRFESEEPVVLSGESREEAGCTIVGYPTPFGEFAFSRVATGRDCAMDFRMPGIIFCHEGPVRLRGGGQDLRLEPGESAFVDAATGELRLSGAGELFVATVPE